MKLNVMREKQLSHCLKKKNYQKIGPLQASCYSHEWGIFEFVAFPVQMCNSVKLRKRSKIYFVDFLRQQYAGTQPPSSPPPFGVEGDLII